MFAFYPGVAINTCWGCLVPDYDYPLQILQFALCSLKWWAFFSFHSRFLWFFFFLTSFPSSFVRCFWTLGLKHLNSQRKLKRFCYRGFLLSFCKWFWEENWAYLCIHTILLVWGISSLLHTEGSKNYFHVSLTSNIFSHMCLKYTLSFYLYFWCHLDWASSLYIFFSAFIEYCYCVEYCC